MDAFIKESKANILQGWLKFAMEGNAGRVSDLLVADVAPLVAECESNLLTYIECQTKLVLSPQSRLGMIGKIRIYIVYTKSAANFIVGLFWEDHFLMFPLMTSRTI